MSTCTVPPIRKRTASRKSKPAPPPFCFGCALKDAEKAGQQEYIVELEETVGWLKGVLRDAIATRDAHIAKLEAMLSLRTGRATSLDTSNPPSKDDVATREERRKRRRERREREREDAPPVEKARGGGVSKRLEPTEKPVYCDPLIKQCSCGRCLEEMRVFAEEARQRIGVRIELVIEDFIARTFECECGARHKGDFPEDIRARVQYSADVRALVCLIGTHPGMSYERTREIVSDILGLDIAEGTIAAWVNEYLATPLREQFMPHVAELLAQAPLTHMDETTASTTDSDMRKAQQAAQQAAETGNEDEAEGIETGEFPSEKPKSKVSGRPYVHVWCTEDLTWLKASYNRVPKNVEEFFGLSPEHKGKLMHDGLGSYWARFEKAIHAICHAHTLRHLEAARKFAGVLEPWVQEAIDALRRLRRIKNGVESPELTEPTVARFINALNEGDRLHPPVREPGKQGPGKRDPAGRIAHFLLGRIDAALRFTHDPDVPFTNNLAESDVRFVKLHEKVSSCWRNIDRANDWLAIRSYLSTLRKHGLPVLPAIKDALAGHPWLPPPR